MAFATEIPDEPDKKFCSQRLIYAQGCERFITPAIKYEGHIKTSGQ